MIKLAIALLLLSTAAYADTVVSDQPYVMREDSIRPKAEYKQEPIITVERYRAPDYAHDATVLIAGKRVTPIFKVSKPEPVTREEFKTFVGTLPKDEGIRVTAQICDDNGCANLEQ